MENILQIADLTKRYPDFYLDHLTLNVPSGSIVGLIGENGAGKTTTMNLILNAVTKDSGDILVFGQDNISHEKEGQICRESIGNCIKRIHFIAIL